MMLSERADIIPGRSLTRSKKVFGRFASSACGAELWDTNGRKYIDMLCALGAVSLGYRGDGYDDGGPRGVYSLPHRRETEAAEAVLTHVSPWASWVRFTKTGSEATHAAYRIAKAATGRETVLRVSGSYHGWHEWCDRTPGTLPPGDKPCAPHAAVFVEPHRFDPVSVDWLKALRTYCDESGALLVFDSMIYGGRWHVGGASAYFGVQPDLECFGKAYGNGQAVSFVVGTAKTYTHGEIASGTFSGELSGLSAVIETLDVYAREPVIETMWARGEQLLEGMRDAIPVELGCANGNPPCQRISWTDDANAQRFTDAMLERGVIWHPNVALTMFAHSSEQIDAVIEAAKDVVASW